MATCEASRCTEQGCCAWQETALVDVPKPPPSAVKTANPDGPAGLYRSTLKLELRVLSYYRDQHTKGSACGWFENFVFRANRLIEIEAGRGC